MFASSNFYLAVLCINCTVTYTDKHATPITGVLISFYHNPVMKTQKHYVGILCYFSSKFKTTYLLGKKYILCYWYDRGMIKAMLVICSTYHRQTGVHLNINDPRLFWINNPQNSAIQSEEIFFFSFCTSGNAGHYQRTMTRCYERLVRFLLGRQTSASTAPRTRTFIT